MRMNITLLIYLALTLMGMGELLGMWKVAGWKLIKKMTGNN